MKRFIILLCIIATLIGTIAIMGSKIHKQREMINVSLQNIAAFAAEKDTLCKQNKQFQYSILELENLNDSLFNIMHAQARKLNIKDKQIQGMQYRLEHIEKRDTVLVRDTIFCKPDFILDTCITDKWSRTCLHLEYPNKIGVSSSFDNEVFVTVHWRKVPIKPRKTKFAEWFTRKRKETVVDVHTDNPYVKNKVQRFVQIVD